MLLLVYITKNQEDQQQILLFLMEEEGNHILLFSHFLRLGLILARSLSKREMEFSLPLLELVVDDRGVGRGRCVVLHGALQRRDYARVARRLVTRRRIGRRRHLMDQLLPRRRHHRGHYRTNRRA